MAHRTLTRYHIGDSLTGSVVPKTKKKCCQERRQKQRRNDPPLHLSLSGAGAPRGFDLLHLDVTNGNARTNLLDSDSTGKRPRGAESPSPLGSHSLHTTTVDGLVVDADGAMVRGARYLQRIPVWIDQCGTDWGLLVY